MGLPPSGAAAITQNFSGLAASLTEGLGDVAALKQQPIPNVAAVSNMRYLALYPDATIGAIAIGLCIELIPLFGILLGFAILNQKIGNKDGNIKTPKRPARSATHSAARPRGRPRLKAVEK